MELMGGGFWEVVFWIFFIYRMDQSFCIFIFWSFFGFVFIFEFCILELRMVGLGRECFYFVDIGFFYFGWVVGGFKRESVFCVRILDSFFQYSVVDFFKVYIFLFFFQS